ncbi:MAG: hypothetical protein HC858_08005, partial [Brachymonas sp.]|nr:hypothetical protein [Brachymonas sp.]
VAVLKYLGRVQADTLRIETPVGEVVARFDEGSQVSFENVASYRNQKDVSICVPDYGTMVGDVAWGGNWFFLMEEHGKILAMENVGMLSEVFVDGAAGGIHPFIHLVDVEIDHICLAAFHIQFVDFAVRFIELVFVQIG